MFKTVKIGLVGTGGIGQVHARSHAAVEGTELSIASLIQPDVERRLADEHGARLYESYEAMLNDDAVDAVDICLPNDLHRDYIVRALEAGKHVLCEKPIALDLDDADAMIGAASASRRLLMVAHPLRFWPEYVIAKQAVDVGHVGQPQLITAWRMVSLLASTQGDRGWRHDPKRSGGAVLDMQIHDIDFFAWTFGKPHSLVSRGIRSPDGALSHVFTHLEFEENKQAFVESSFMLKGNPLGIGFRILGTQRSIEYRYLPRTFSLHGVENQEDPPEPSLVLYEWGKDPVPLHTPEEDSFIVAFREEMRYFAECVRTRRPPEHGSPAQARLALEIALASRRSCESREMVQL
ncbi:MAG: Gfo/Idh/MocA family oxidoreductase [Pirellulales bacterium]|nr:Gfo/Idh/MocA family oxidoreductase [Pirellulales bacterium]